MAKFLQEGDCIHGFRRYECATCYHPSDTCSFGHCQKKATVKVSFPKETRHTCKKHGVMLADLNQGTIQAL